MPPTLPADDNWRQRLATLRASLDELHAAMRGGHWERLAQLAPDVDRAVRRLRALPAAPSLTASDAEGLRQTLTLADTLQVQVRSRQQQIKPLLEAWRKAPAAEPDGPPP